MESFSDFFNELLSNVEIKESKKLTIEQVRAVVSNINEYFYTYSVGIGQTFVLDEYRNYFSEFHKFWEKYHEQIISPKIIDSECRKTAKILNDLSLNFGKKLFYELYDTKHLEPEEICKVRYLSANQDFRGSRDFEELIDRYDTDPTIFDKDNIFENPEDFLRNIGITSLSQNDKRVKYALTASKLLIDLNLEPFDLFQHFNKDVLKIREFLLSNKGSGFGNKKIDMFIRDMVVLKVWKNPMNFESINVASDINTIKVALRTGIIETSIPLVSSFLDIFCYQYGLMDEMSAKAWRRVWEFWNHDYPDTCIESPCLIDYLVYRIIGKDFCKEKLNIYECETKEHKFKWHTGRNKKCQVCKEHRANVISKVLPCTDEEGHIVIERSEYVGGKTPLLKGIRECPFVSVCNPKDSSFKKLNPPKSISILGQTGWESARTLSGEGGGGLMS